MLFNASELQYFVSLKLIILFKLKINYIQQVIRTQCQQLTILQIQTQKNKNTLVLIHINHSQQIATRQQTLQIISLVKMLPSSSTPLLGKKPSLSQSQLKKYRMILQQFDNQNDTYFYNIVSKQSNWGFSQNQRLLILNVKNQTIGYLSKIPQGCLPFQRIEEIQVNKEKEKIHIHKVQNFNCNPVKGKISSFFIQWDDADKKKHTWNFVLGSSKLMNDWVTLINSILNKTYAKNKYDEMKNINSTSPITSPIDPMKANTSQNPIKQNNLQNQIINKNPQNLKTPGNNLQDPNKNLQNPINNQQNPINNIQNPINKIQDPTNNIQNPSNNIKNPINNIQNRTNPQAAQNRDLIPIQKQIYPSQQIQPSLLKKQASTPKFDPQLSHPNLNYPQQQPKINIHTVNTPSSSNLSNYPLNNQASNPIDNLSNNPSRIDSFYQPLNQSNIINPTEQTLNRKSTKPGDFVEELKRYKVKNPDKFDLTNDLSVKKLHPYNDVSNHPIQNQQPDINPFTKKNNYINQDPINTYTQPHYEKKPSQKVFNRQNSAEKKFGQQSPDQQPRFQRYNTKKSNLSKLNQNQNKRGPIPVSLGLKNNFEELELNQPQVYKPSNNFPQSTKNLTKIRSDYLQRITQKNIQKLPQTSKNKSRLLQQPSVSRPLNAHPSRLRQDSLLNLSKINSTYLNSLQTHKHWNEIWLETSNPNKKLEIHEQFVKRSEEIGRQLVEELMYKAQLREFRPIQHADNVFVFAIQDLIFQLHFFQNHQSVNDSRDGINADAPVLYQHSTYDQLKRQFYNYNLILSVTNNQTFVKVPLACLFQYRGILVLCKADVPAQYKQVEPYQYKQQFQALQNIIKVRFMFGSFNIFESSNFRGPESKFILLWNLKNLIPGIPNTVRNETSYFRKQFLLQYDEILQDLQSSSQAHAFTLRHIIPDLLMKLQSLEIQLIHSKDLMRQMHQAGLSASYLPNLFQQTSSIYLKKIFMSEIVAGIFTCIVRSQLNHAFSILPSQNIENVSSDQLNDIIVDCAHVLINELFSYSLRAQNIWKIIVQQASKRYQIIVSKQSIISGYLLSGITFKCGLLSDFKQKSFPKQSSLFFTQQSLIPRSTLLTFLPSTRRYNIQSIDPTYSKCLQIISNEPTLQNYQHLVMILGLKSRKEFQEYFSGVREQLKAYLCNFIPFKNHEQQEFEQLDLYQYLYEEPLTVYSLKSSFLAVKWLIKDNEVERANQIFQIKFHQLSFWFGQYNPSITEFYDFFSMFYASVGDYQQSICLAKSSLINVHKILGQQALPVADKHYQLGNIYFKIGRKNEALKQYNKTKSVLMHHNKTNIPEYGVILLKISLLCLNFGQLTECIANALQAESIFQQNQGNQTQQIQCFQILARVYEITKQTSEMSALCQGCSKTFNHTQNPTILCRMLKIILLPKLSILSSQQKKLLLPILQKLSSQIQHTPIQAFTYLHKKSQSFNLKKKLYQYLENVGILIEEINRKDLLRKYGGWGSRINSQAEEMIGMVQAVGIVTGFGFFIGLVKDNHYQ